MKKVLLLISVLFASGILHSFAGTNFEGKVVYSIDLDNMNLPPEAKAMMGSSEISMYIKGTKSRTEMNMGFQNTITISDEKTKISVMLMDIMGNKYQIKMDEAAKKKEADKMPEISVKYLDETKEIAGYKCKKAELTFTDKSGTKMTTNIFYTEEIANYMGYDGKNYQFKDIKGMPLEYEIKMENGMKMKMTAKSVSKEAVPDSKFDIPSGYTETTIEDLQKNMMKNMQQH